MGQVCRLSQPFVLLLCGGLFWFPNRHHKHELKARDGFNRRIVLDGNRQRWRITFCSQPIPTFQSPMRFLIRFGVNAHGATVIVCLDELPKAILSIANFAMV